MTAAPTSTGDNDHEDAESIQGHIDSMKTEMGKEKPRNTILKQLMKFTYTTRREFILGGFTTVAAVLETYPALKKPAVVCSFTFLSSLFQVEQEMTMILDKADYLLLPIGQKIMLLQFLCMQITVERRQYVT